MKSQRNDWTSSVSFTLEMHEDIEEFRRQLDLFEMAMESTQDVQSHRDVFSIGDLLEGFVRRTQGLRPSDTPDAGSWDPYHEEVWVKCNSCEGYWCTVHRDHTDRCPCPEFVIDLRV